MNQIFSDFSDDFLLPSEGNFPDLIDKIQFLHSRVVDQVDTDVPRVPLTRYAYKDIAFSIPRHSSTSNEVLAQLAQAFQGSIRWHQPTALMNITPNPLLDAVAASTMASLYNTNAFWDYASGNVTKFEKEVVHFLSYLANWRAEQTDGLSVSGGKATIMYAIKCGLNNCDRRTVQTGLTGEYVVIASKNAHYSIEDCCNYLGIGRANVVRVAVTQSGTLDTEAFELALRDAVRAGKKIAAVIALGGDTLEYAVDPIKQLNAIRQDVSEEFNLGYIPYLHVDSVNAWISLVFGDYDFAQNTLNLGQEALYRIRTLSEKMSQVTWADSFSADFHKTGLAPYISSFFVAKDGRRIQSINKRQPLETMPSHAFGEVHTHHVSFDNSRSAGGILAAWTSMKRLGIAGYQRYWAQLTEQSGYLRKTIRQKYSKEIRVLNTTALGHANVVQLVPPHASYEFDALLSDSKSLQAYSEYCFGLYDFMAHELLGKATPYPLLGFVPNYKSEFTGIKRPAFLIYLNHPHMDEVQCNKLLTLILEMKHTFDRNQRSAARQASTPVIKQLPK